MTMATDRLGHGSLQPKDRGVADILRALLPKPLWRLLRGIGTAVLGPVGFSIRTGHWRTALTGKIVDARGNPMPWYSYPLLDFLAERDFTGARVLEFGGGYSTLWWVSKGASVFVIEPDAEWARWLAERTRDLPVEVYHAPCDNISREMNEVEALLRDAAGPFDIIVVDGHLRQECALASAPYLASRGAMLIDNFETMDFSGILSRPRCRKIDFIGLYADGHMPSRTVMLFWGDCALLETGEPQFATMRPQQQVFNRSARSPGGS